MEEENELNIMDCEVYTYNLTHGMYDEEEEEIEENPYHIYKCLNCGFVFHTGEPPIITDGKEDERKKKAQLDNKEYEAPKLNLSEYTLASDSSRFRCPVCSRIVPYVEIKEEEYKKVIERKRKRAEEKKKRQDTKKRAMQERVFRINIYRFNKELKDLTDELAESLANREITPQRFVSLYRALSFKLFNKYEHILNSYGLNLDTMEFKKISEELSDDVLKFNKVQEKTEDLLEWDEKKIENDPVYAILNKKHIIDNPVETQKDALTQELDDDAEERYWIAKHEAYTKKVNEHNAKEAYEQEKLEQKRKEAQEKRKSMIKEDLNSLSHTIKTSKK